jgi:hypothetical protein
LTPILPPVILIEETLGNNIAFAVTGGQVQHEKNSVRPGIQTFIHEGFNSPLRLGPPAWPWTGRIFFKVPPMSNDPAFLFYDGDAARDVSHMNRLERGAYFDIIQAQRKFGPLSLPQIQKILGKDFDSCWPSIELIMQKEGESYSLVWLKESILRRKHHCEQQKQRVMKRWASYHGNTTVIPRVYLKENENENENEEVKENENYLTENILIGSIPEDVRKMISTLKPLPNALDWQYHVQGKFEDLGFDTKIEVPCVSEYGQGRIDIVAVRGDYVLAIECDYRTPRQKSIAKIKTYPNGIVILRDPKLIKPSVTEREAIFRQQVFAQTEHPEQMLMTFFNYWSEIDPSGKKMRFEKQPTWELKKRLATWRSRDHGTPSARKTHEFEQGAASKYDRHP